MSRSGVRIVGATRDEWTFGALLRRYRRAVGLSQEALAERAGLSTQAISALERGVRQAPYHDTVRALCAALDLGSADRTALEATIARHRGPATTLAATPDASAVPGLPTSLDALLGRDDAVAALAAALGAGERLITLTGPGGVGKTRLAVAVAAQFVAGTVCFVSLASLRDPGLVASAIAEALGLRETGESEWAAVVRAALADRHLLLVLDNFEHLMPAASLLAELLVACPHVVILATSRAPLHLRGERPYAVAPLTTPEPDRLPALATLARVPAVALFVRQARAAVPGFALSAANATAVAAICRRLDGLPLALELAAARVRLLTPAALLARLSPTLPLLTGGARDLPERHQTLRATLNWSHDLLRPGEQAIFRRLAVCAGGCTLEAAAVICGAGEPLAVELLDWLGALLDQGLVQRTIVLEAPEEEPRFTMLETVREYGLECLAREPSGPGESAATLRRHAAYYLGLAEEAEPHLTGAGQAPWLARLAREHDNLRAALEWSLGAEGDVGTALRLAAAIWRFWLTRGYAGEGRRWLGRALAAAPEAAATAPARAKALAAVGALAHSQGDYASSAALTEESLVLWRVLGDQVGIAGALGTLAMVHKSRGDHAAAMRLFEEALARWRALGQDLKVSMTLNNLGATAYDLGDFARFEGYIAESLVIKRALGDGPGIAIALFNLGEAARSQGRLAQSRELLAESLLHFRELRSTPRIAHVLHSLGVVAQGQGDGVAASAALAEGLATFRALGDRGGLALCLEGWALVASGRGEDRQAARLFGVADALRADLGFPVAPVDRADHERAVAGVKARLTTGAFAAAWTAARALPLDDVVDEILRDAAEPAPAPGVTRPPAQLRS